MEKSEERKMQLWLRDLKRYGETEMFYVQDIRNLQERIGYDKKISCEKKIGYILVKIDKELLKNVK